MKANNLPVMPPPVYNNCPHGALAECYECLSAPPQPVALIERLRHPLNSRMVLCPACRSKRCPKARNHENPCAEPA